jgi:hypothetical protein
LTNKKYYDKINIENEKRKGDKQMRKLTYEIFKGNEKVNEVATYEEMKKFKSAGFTVKDKLTEIHERTVFEIYKGEEKVDEVTTFKARKEYTDKGYTFKAVARVY